MSSTAWKRYFICVRGHFVFLFNTPNSEQPESILTLANLTIALPEGNGKLFEDKRLFRANDGFEFEIRYKSLPSATGFTKSAGIRFYTLSEDERCHWVDAFRARVKPDAEKENLSIKNLLGAKDFRGRRVLVTETLMLGPPPKKAQKAMQSQSQSLTQSQSQQRLTGDYSRGGLGSGQSQPQSYLGNSVSPYAQPPLPSGDDYSAYSSLGSNKVPKLFSYSGSGPGFKMPQGMGMGEFDELGSTNSSSYDPDHEGDEEEKALMEALDKDMQERMTIEHEARDREAVAREM